MAHRCNNAVWSALESHLVPPLPSTNWYYSTLLKNSVVAVCLLPVGIVTGSFVGFYKVCSYAASYWTKPEIIDPKNNFQAVVDDSRLWNKLGTLKELEQDLIDDPLNLKLMGPATCTYQDSPKSCPNSQWTPWIDKVVDPANRPDDTPGLFTLYESPAGRKELIERLQKLNANAYRFSVEWSHLEPKPGQWDDTKLQVYVDLSKALLDAGIEPMVTLHHFSEPNWFHLEGSFEKEENIQYFTQFARKVGTALRQDYNGRALVEYFCTINEPAVEAFSRYVLGSFSPGNICNFAKAGNFLKNALKAHCAVYDMFKQMNHAPQVGIVHQYIRFIPTNFLVYPVTKYLNQLFAAPMEFFRNEGKFELKVPFLCNIEEQCKKPETDFVGVQYYTLPVISLTGPTTLHGEPMTQMPFHEAPAGIYEAMVESHKAFNADVMITENGISTHNDRQRKRYMTRALYAVREAAKHIGKEKVRAYFPWSLGDNLEWNMGMRPQAFGAFALTPEGLAKEPKPGMASYIRIAAAWTAVQKATRKIA